METLDDLRQGFFDLSQQTEKLIDRINKFATNNAVKNEPLEKLIKANDILGSVMDTIDFAGSFLDED